MKVTTTPTNPPPDRPNNVWKAHYEEEGPTGYGETEVEALRDLAEQVGLLWMEAP